MELELAGELDLVSAPRLAAAVRWLQARYRHTIVLDTRRLAFVDLHGYRALRAAVDGTGDHHGPRTIHVVGDVLARFHDHLATALALAAGQSGQNGSGRSVPTS